MNGELYSVPSSKKGLFIHEIQADSVPLILLFSGLPGIFPRG